MHGARGAQHVEPVAAAHLEIAQDDVEIGVVQTFDGGIAIRRLFNLVSGFGKPAGKAPAERVVIVSDEKRGRCSTQLSEGKFARTHYLNQLDALATGRVTRNLVPRPGSLLTSMRPSWASTIFLTLGSPSPDPWGFVV